MPKNREKSLEVLISEHKNTKINSLPTDMQVLFGFLTLIVDIKYRIHYESPLMDETEASRMVEQKSYE
jgi:hypothetical protein